MDKEAAARILGEASDWQHIMSLETDKTIDVYFDVKSPHAYLAIRPTIEIMRDYKVRVNFVPYTLSYRTLGVSTSVEKDMKRRPESAAADRKARMYYAAAREYAALQQLPFRSPYRLLDSELSHKVFLRAKQQGVEVPYLMDVYVHGWGSGWREYEVESLDQLTRSLEAAGGNSEGLAEFVSAEGAGTQELQELHDKAEASGITGVPHYVFADVEKGRDVGLFGREHLALLREKFGNEGLARNGNVKPDFSHAWRGPV